MSDRIIIQSCWTGLVDPLTNLERLCAQSFIEHGHEFHLYTYTDVGSMPDGVTIKNANEILPEKDIYRHQRGSLALFSDWFRWKLLHTHGNWWVDMDVVCLRRFDLTDDIVFCVGGGYCVPHAMKFPAGHPFCAHMVDRCAHPNKIFREDSLRVGFRKVKRAIKGLGKAHTRWGESGGPTGFTAAAKRFDLMTLGKSAETFSPESAFIVDASGAENPRRWHEILLQNAGGDASTLFPNSFAFHIGTEWLRLAGYDKNATYPKESLFEQLKRRHAI